MGNNKENNRTTDLVVDEKTNELQLGTFDEIWKLSSLLVKSDLFGTKNTNEVATKIITGLEMGISPVRAVRHIDTIDGSPSVSAQLSAAMIQMSKNYDYSIDEVSVSFNNQHEVIDGRAEVSIYFKDEKLGSAEFTWDEANAANLTWKDNWEKYPRDMLFARAMKRAKKWYAPSIGIGREYMPDELGSEGKPTVSVPDDVKEKAQQGEPTKDDGEVTEVDYEVESEPDFTEKAESSTTKEKKTEKEDDDLELEMQVSSVNGDQSESEEEPESEHPDWDKPQSSIAHSEPRAIPGGIDHLETDDKIEQVKYELNRKSGTKLKAAINRYWAYWDNCSDGEFKDDLFDVLYNKQKEINVDLEESPVDIEDEEESQSEPTGEDVSLDDLKSATQDVIREIDDNLSSLQGEDLQEQINNYRGEASKWSEPAKSVLKSVLDEHEERVDVESTSEDTNEDKLKERQASWGENLSRAQTMMGMKIKETHQWEPLHKLVDGLTKKCREFIDETEEMFGDTDLADNMQKQWEKAVAPYSTIVSIRAAVVQPDEPDYDQFDQLIQDFTSTIKSWDDKEKAKKAHDIVGNEVERLVDKVDNFHVTVE